MTDDPIMTEQTDLMQYVPKVHFEQIPIKNLVSNQEYQRNLSQHHVQRAAANFDLYQINPVKVSRRNGINYVFNGQHTIEIVALVSGSSNFFFSASSKPFQKITSLLFSFDANHSTNTSHHILSVLLHHFNRVK